MLNRFLNVTFTISAIICLTSCTHTIQKPILIDQGKVQFFTHSSTQRSTFLKTGEPGLWLCKETVGDAVKTSGDELTLGVANESLGGGVSKGAQSLGGMAPEVFITSELLYRACELSANLNADRKLTLQIYQMFLDAVKKTAKTQTENGATENNGNQVLPANDQQKVTTDSSAKDDSGESDQ